jgi:hypothetical protein
VKNEIQRHPNGTVSILTYADNGEVWKCIVDVSDYNKLKEVRMTWKVVQVHNGSFRTKGHYNGKTVDIARVIMDCPQGMVVDHIDGNALNNRRHNLRIVTPAENKRNMPGTHYRLIHYNNKEKCYKIFVGDISEEQDYYGNYKVFDDALNEVLRIREMLTNKKFTHLYHLFYDPEQKRSRSEYWVKHAHTSS